MTGDPNDQIFAAPDAAAVLPEFKFPDEERAAQEVYQLGLMLDGSARQNLATFCQTWEELKVHHLVDAQGVSRRTSRMLGENCAIPGC